MAISMKYSLRYYQKQASDSAVRFFSTPVSKYHALEVLPTGCHAKGSKILLYGGSTKNVEDISIGDILMGDDGTKRNVLQLHNGFDDMYKIIPIKGEPFVVNGGHILSLYKTNEGHLYNCEKSRIDEISVRDYLKQTDYYRHIHKLHRSKCIEFHNNKVLPIRVERRKTKPLLQKKSVLVTGFSVEYVGKGEYFGFTLDGNHLYCDNQFFIHHNSGKSLVIADIASRLSEPTIVFQPNKEILEQNFAKLRSYGVEDCSIYSASMNRKEISKITFATIGSVANHMEDFRHFRNIIIDEAHECNPRGGMYKDFIEDGERKVLGLTATPYRLDSINAPIRNERGELVRDIFGEIEKERRAILRFLTRCKPRIFCSVIYACQVSELLQQGYLAQMQYYDVTPKEYQQGRLRRNTTGRDFDDSSVEESFQYFDMYTYLISIVKRVLHPKQGVPPRRGILVFTKNIIQAQALTAAIPNSAFVTGETKKKEREDILQRFKAGELKVVANVGVLTTGFDYPELDTVIMARPTMSLALYYQVIGRAIRPFPGKQPWFIDLCGNIKTFGRVENLRIDCPGAGKWMVNGWIDNQWKQLTNVIF